MALQDTVLQGSFRGVPFETRVAQGVGGRRWVVHEYPQSDVVELEDNGGGAEQFSLDLFVNGLDYADKRDALRDALRAPGTGTLVHPWRGNIECGVGSWSEDHSGAEGRMCTFRVTFLVGVQPTLPAVSIDTQAATEALAADADLAVADDFATSVDLSTERGLSLAILTDAMAPIAQLTREIRDTASDVQRALVTGLLDPIAGARDVLADMLALPGDIAMMAAGLLTNITNAADLDALWDRYTTSSSGPLGVAFTGTLGTSTVTAASSILASSPKAREMRNRINRVFRTATAVQEARLSARTTFVSYDEARATIARVLEHLDTLAPEVDDATFVALQDLRAAVVADVTARAADLARVTRYTPKETLPALVIAQKLYGAAGCIERADELVARNGLAHPGFVPGGQEIEVLTQ